MAEDDGLAAAVARLETALMRIAAAAERPRAPAEPAPDTAEIAARLDAIILEVRAALGPAAAKEPA